MYICTMKQNHKGKVLFVQRSYEKSVIYWK